MSLTDFTILVSECFNKDFDPAYIGDYIFFDGGLLTVSDPDILPEREMSDHDYQEGSMIVQENLSQYREARNFIDNFRSLARILKPRAQPSHNLQRVPSSSSITSYSSQRLHEVLRAHVGLTAFPTFRRNPTFLQRKAPPKGHYRSLTGDNLCTQSPGRR